MLWPHSAIGVVRRGGVRRGAAAGGACGGDLRARRALEEREASSRVQDAASRRDVTIERASKIPQVVSNVCCILSTRCRASARASVWIVPVSSTFLRRVPPSPVVAALAAIITFGSGSFLAQQAPFASHQVEIEPELDAAVHRYFETQEKEDVAGYIDMWSSAAQRPSPAMLKFIFDAGDDQYPEIAHSPRDPHG